MHRTVVEKPPFGETSILRHQRTGLTCLVSALHRHLAATMLLTAVSSHQISVQASRTCLIYRCSILMLRVFALLSTDERYVVGVIT